MLTVADELRRQQGRLLDALGFGPQCTPSRTVRNSRLVRLLAYQAADAHRPPILVVPAPIKTAYIWDLAPGASAVERLLGASVQVYLAAWERPQAGDEGLGLAQYADEAISACLDTIEEETGQGSSFLAGHSLGGTLAAIFASLHPERVRALVELEGPMAFGAGAVEAALAGGVTVDAMAGPSGNVPGTFIDLGSVYADPLTFNAEPWLDWLHSSPLPAAHRLHWQVRRWSLDESPMARRLFVEVTEALYRENRFAEGRLRLAGRPANPRSLRAPILAVVDPRSRLVPPASIEAYRTHTASREAQILEYRGDTGVMLQHVGVLVGKSAHEQLWPQIVRWVEQQ